MSKTMNGTTNRITDSVKPKRKPARKRSTKKKGHTLDAANFGVGFMAILSAILNGYANSQHAPLAAAGWLMGFAIPIIVLVLGKVAGDKLGKCRWIAFFAAGSGLSLLLLSVYHCAVSIAVLTGSSLFLAFPMAVAIDFGFVACEVAVIYDRQ